MLISDYHKLIQSVLQLMISEPFANQLILEDKKLPTEKYSILYIYLTPVKTQLLQYNLTRNLMLFYHSNKLKSINLWSRYQANTLFVQIKQSR